MVFPVDYDKAIVVFNDFDHHSKLIQHVFCELIWFTEKTYRIPKQSQTMSRIAYSLFSG